MDPSWAEEEEEGHAMVGLQQDVESRLAVEEALARNRNKATEYRLLSLRLAHLLKNPSHPIMAPVCGGLAYFDGRLIETNALLILLGDGVFALRSVEQAQSIVKRRLVFLTHEEQQLVAERDAITARIDFAANVSSTAASTMGKSAAVKPHRSAEPSDNKTASNLLDTDNVVNAGPMEEADSDVDEADLLSPDEIAAIEEELGDDAWDEDKAEAALQRAVREKRSARLAREARARQAQLHVAAATPNPPTTKVRFTTPGDIGRMAIESSVPNAVAPVAPTMISNIVERTSSSGEPAESSRPVAASSKRQSLFKQRHGSDH